MVGAGMAGAEQYATQLQNQRLTAIQGYAQQLTTLATENQQYMTAFDQHAAAVYNSLMTDLGLEKAAMDQSFEWYAQYITPQLDQMSMELTEYIKKMLPELMG
jgi:coproporphyrinogen III oxidase-like Fe-S oxidoreductase